MESGIQPVMNVGGGYGYGDGCFGGNGLWLFAILALMNGGFWGRNGVDGRCATVEDINNSANFTRLESQVQANGQAIAGVNTNLSNAICSLGYEMANKFGETDKQIAECCCGINRNIDAVRYENALNTAAINANTTAGIQKVLDKLCADNTAALQTRISQLELKDALCGVVRYPQNFSYAVGTPFNVGIGCGCGCGNI